MKPFATVEQYEKRYGAAEDKKLLKEVLSDATRLIASELERARIPIDDERTADVRMQVCRSVAFRALAQGDDASLPVGIKQYSQAVGPYTESISVSNQYREVYLTKAEKRMLGLGRSRIGFIAPKGASYDS